MGVYPVWRTAYTCRIIQSYHIHNSPLPPHIWLLVFILPKSGLLSVPLSSCPSHANDGSSFHCSDNPVASQCTTGSSKQSMRQCCAQGGIRIYSPFAWAEDFEMSQPKVHSTLPEFTLKCINSLHPTTHFPSFQSNIHNLHCLDYPWWLLNAQLDPPSSTCDIVVLGYIPPLHWLKILNVSARSALNVTKEFTLKCINSLHPTTHFPLFQSNIHNLSSIYSI
jgi:hypothetical protein